MAAINVIQSENCVLEIRSPSSALESANYHKIIGASSYEESGGEAPTRTPTNFDGSTTIRGQAQPPTVTFSGQYNPRHLSWRILREAYGDNHTVSVRLTTARRAVSVETGRMIAIATTGIGTISGGTDPHAYFDPDKFAPGQSVEIEKTGSTTSYVILSITGEGTSAKPYQPNFSQGDIGTAITASAFSMAVSSYRRGPYDCSVTVADRGTMATESELEASVTLTAVNAILPEWVIVEPS